MGDTLAQKQSAFYHTFIGDNFYYATLSATCCFCNHLLRSMLIMLQTMRSM